MDQLQEALKLRYEPVAVCYTNEKPEAAKGFPESKWGCVASLHMAAAKGHVFAFDRKTFGCPSGGIGLGFKLPFRPKLAEFLSTGSPEQMGEHYWKTPELAQAFIDQLPVTNVPEEFVVFSPLSKAPCEPTVVSIYVNPDQLSALVVLASYARKTNENIIVPMGAGCHTSVLYALKECDNESPRAVLGMTDITARPYVDPDLVAVSMPYGMYQELLDNVEGSFLGHKDWLRIKERIR